MRREVLEQCLIGEAQRGLCLGREYRLEVVGVEFVHPHQTSRYVEPGLTVNHRRSGTIVWTSVVLFSHESGEEAVRVRNKILYSHKLDSTLRGETNSDCRACIPVHSFHDHISSREAHAQLNGVTRVDSEIRSSDSAIQREDRTLATITVKNGARLEDLIAHVEAGHWCTALIRPIVG